MREFVRIIVIQNNKYLLIRENKKVWFNGWIFPGGKVETGETPESAAIRELREEINIDVNEDKLKLWYKTDCSFASGDWRGFYFICENCNLNKLKICEPNKCEGYGFFDFDELKNIDLVIPEDVILILEKYDSDMKK